ncbi:MAG: diacylglycerol kinase family protein [Planctomycetota bacterium]
MTPGRILLVANPAAGRGKALRVAEEAARALVGRGVEARAKVAASAADLARLAADPELGPSDAVCGVGGDGTLHGIVAGLVARGEEAPALAVVPCGTGNSLARDHGQHRVADAVERIATGERRAIDLAEVELDGERVHAFHVIGWGASAWINRRAERLRRLGGARYVAAALVEIARGGWPPPGDLAGGMADAILGAACLTRHTGGGIPLSPTAELDDGFLHVLEVRRKGRLGLARVLVGALRGRHLGVPGVELRKLREIELTLPEGATITLDGEDRPARRVRARVLPRALGLLG